MAKELLRGARCSQCGLLSFDEQENCSHCGSMATEPFAADGTGRLLSWSIVRVAPARFAAIAPYAICAVELEGGDRVLGRLQTIPDETIAIGGPVAFVRKEEGGVLLFAMTQYVD